MEEETAVLNATERIHIKCRLKSIQMDLVTQWLLVTLANFHVSDQVTPLIKVFKASQCPPGKVISTPPSLLTTSTPSPQAPAMPNYSHGQPCCSLCLKPFPPLKLPYVFPSSSSTISSRKPSLTPRLGWVVVFSSLIAPCVGMSKVHFPPVTYIVHLGPLVLWPGTAPLCSQACRQANLDDENGSTSSFPLTR